MRPASYVSVPATAAQAFCAAIDPEEASIGKQRSYRAFQPPRRGAVPEVRSPWVRTPFDAFLPEAMRAKGLSPSPKLDRKRLPRRVTLDLTGLPPAPGETARFLASPHCGERWALRWLDVVRYADTNSDELWPGDTDAPIATGFHRAGPIQLAGGNQDEEVSRQEVLTETGEIGSKLEKKYLEVLAILEGDRTLDLVAILEPADCAGRTEPRRRMHAIEMTAPDAAKAAADGDNKLYWRMNRQ